MTQSELEAQLKKELDKERYRHTIGVMYTAGSLAMAHGENLEKALLAGLLHDCAKCIPNEKKLKLCKKAGIPITEAEEKSPFLLHAKLGAYLAKENYDVTDEEILHAIRVHTTGAPGMNRLDQIIYIADYIEPNRNKAENLPLVRSMAFTDLEKTMQQILRDSLQYLSHSKETIDPMTEETYRYFCEKNVAKET